MPFDLSEGSIHSVKNLSAFLEFREHPFNFFVKPP